ncbi:MAG TPA: haloacid dehalogenase type II [Bryobacteraceae bacterium]|jgi:2-haloacid dehalogenase|nr:haloacid dehalogenase type II [Bryobacteraceae bacterium]
MSPKAILFDAYGTLFDVHSVVDDAALSQLWRRTQIELTWRCALMERYEDFWQITQRALRIAVNQLSITHTDTQLERLMRAWLSPTVFEDARRALDQLRRLPLGILSNGTPAMLEAAILAGGLESHFAHVISVDSIRTFKPSPRVYALGAETLNLPPAEILFVSSNLWDVEGAKAFGYPVCWCNRFQGDAEAAAFPPDFTVTALDHLPERLA